jgi:hypothetical protein
MRSRHRTKAIVGVAVWVGVILGAIIFRYLGPPAKGTGPEVERGFILLGWLMLAHFFWFFWAAYHLARAKGYSESLLVFGLLCVPGQLVLLLVLLVLPDKHRTQPVLERAHREHRGSEIERRARYRRNALLGNVLGLCGVTLGVYVVALPMGLTRDPGTEKVFGILVFLAGYCGLISGCWFWLKAKHWNEAVVLIGLAPVLILFIPYVRLLLIAVPSLLTLGMTIMPILMLVVVMALPDYSRPISGGGSWSPRRTKRRHSSPSEPEASGTDPQRDSSSQP